MIFHSIYTITINNFALGFKFPNKVKCLPIPMPKKWVERAFNKLVVANNINTNGEEKDELIDDKYHFTSLGIRIELLRVIFKGLEHSWIVGADEGMLNHYKDYFKRDFDEYGLQMIVKEIKKLSSKHAALGKKLYPEPDENQPKEVDRFEYFQEMIVNIESHLHPEKIGNDKLYLLPIHISKANRIMKSKQPK